MFESWQLHLCLALSPTTTQVTAHSDHHMDHIDCVLEKMIYKLRVRVGVRVAL